MSKELLYVVDDGVSSGPALTNKKVAVLRTTSTRVPGLGTPKGVPLISVPLVEGIRPPEEV